MAAHSSVCSEVASHRLHFKNDFFLKQVTSAGIWDLGHLNRKQLHIFVVFFREIKLLPGLQGVQSPFSTAGRLIL